MSSPRSPVALHRPSLSFILLALLLCVLWLAGGASRGEVLGQTLVRGSAWAALTVTIGFGTWPKVGASRPVVFLLVAAVLLAILQLVPLPPGIWQALPRRGVVDQSVTFVHQPWRPLAIAPAAALNACLSLVVPIAILVTLAGATDRERRWLPGFLLGLVTASMLVGLLQFSGARFDNPLINDVVGEVAGTFANRNHFALLLAMGCLLAPVWAFLDGRRPQWRGPVALGLVTLFTLTILASGSRSGFLTGALALALGLAIVWADLWQALRRYPKWVSIALLVALIVLVLGFIGISILAGRAVSVERLLAADPAQDMRTRGLPVVLAMIREYFPLGSGLGGFDAVFRMHEPFSLVKPTYFNHAHNDFLEVVLDAGLPGLLLMAAALGWWGWASVRGWRADGGMRAALPKLGSAMLLLVIVAGALDYPARTPMMMALMVIAAGWLSQDPGQALGSSSRSALPGLGQHL